MTKESSVASSPVVPTPPPVPVLKQLAQLDINDNQTANQINEIDLIRPNLYLGGIEAAYNAQLLKQLNITHCLTIEDNELDVTLYRDLEKYKFKKLSDNPYANLLDVLDECVQFVDEAISESKNVLVHWYNNNFNCIKCVLIEEIKNFCQVLRACQEAPVL